MTFATSHFAKGNYLGFGASGWLIPQAENQAARGNIGQRDETKATPELAFAVKPGLRRRGFGAALLTQLVKATPQQSTISIRAPTNNPAVRLYERFGFKVVEQSEGAVRMRREA